MTRQFDTDALCRTFETTKGASHAARLRHLPESIHAERQDRSELRGLRFLLEQHPTRSFYQALKVTKCRNDTPPGRLNCGPEPLGAQLCRAPNWKDQPRREPVRQAPYLWP